MSSAAFNLFVLTHSPDCIGHVWQEQARTLAARIITGNY